MNFNFLKARSLPEREAGGLKAISGFTLIELLIVIAIIAILAGVVFVSLNPLKRFQDARNASRWTDVTAVLSAIKVDQVDNGGSYLWAVSNATAGDNLQISNATTTTACNTNCSAINQAAGGADDCVNLQGLVDEGYLGDFPVSPNGNGSWSAALSGYYMSRNTNNGSITVAACDAEGGETISVNR